MSSSTVPSQPAGPCGAPGTSIEVAAAAGRPNVAEWPRAGPQRRGSALAIGPTRGPVPCGLSHMSRGARMAPRRRWSVWLAWTVLAVGLAAAGCAPSASPAAPRAGPASDEKAVADFYRGKTIQLVVATGAGGGFDIYSRQIAPYLSKHIPGNPTIVVDNKPGAGHMIGMNYVYNVAPRNGLAIGNATGGLAIAQVFGARGVEFDMTQLEYLGIPATETMVMIVSREAGVQRLDELLGPGSKQLVLGGTGPGSLQEDLPVLLRDVLGANVKIVSGYEGTNTLKAALERGEIQSFFNTWESSKSTDRARFDSG